MQIIVYVIGGIVVILIIAEGLGQLFYFFVNPACGLRRSIFFRDHCAGPCLPGQVCVATAVRPYGPFGLFGVQDSACACGAAGTGVAGGTGAPAAGVAGGGGGGGGGAAGGAGGGAGGAAGDDG